MGTGQASLTILRKAGDPLDSGKLKAAPDISRHGDNTVTWVAEPEVRLQGMNGLPGVLYGNHLTNNVC
ncbi:hypothetical protein D3C81_1615130 [compost metagenome]